MSEIPPPRDPHVPSEDETVIVPPADETVVEEEWGPETEVFVEETETVPPRRTPLIWPWLLALLVLVLVGLGVFYFVSRDDNDAVATSAASTTTTAPTTTQEAATVSVPDVVGTTSSEATAALRQVGLAANLVAVPSDRPAGSVVAQNPAAGEEAPEGSTVRLNVAQPAQETTPPPATTAPVATTAPIEPEPATVPDVVGDELADAARAFGDEGLKVSVKYVPSTEPQGRVVAQARPAGTELKPGDTVQVNVSEGVEPAAATQVPDVVGKPQTQARTALEGAGFEVLAIELESNATGVFAQSPAGGASIPRGSLVLLYVPAPD
jgi:beta-lactam-binding protein with PASTA domain